MKAKVVIIVQGKIIKCMKPSSRIEKLRAVLLIICPDLITLKGPIPSLKN